MARDSVAALRWPAAVFAIALLARLGLWLAVGDVNPSIGDDQQDYLGLRDSLLRTGSLLDPRTGLPTAYRDPGYPVFLALLSWAGIGSVTGIIAVQAVLGALTGAVLTRAAHLAYGGRAARFTGLLFLLHGSFASYALLLYPETLYGLVLSLLLLWLARLQRGWAAAILAGATAACSLLVRAAGMVGLGLLLWEFLRPFRGASAARKIALVAIPALAVTLWSLRNLDAVGVFAPNTSGAANVYLGNRAALDPSTGERNDDDPTWTLLTLRSEAERSRESIRLAVDYARRDPGSFARNLFWKIPGALEADRMFLGVGRKGQFPERGSRSLFVLGGLLLLVTCLPTLAAAVALLSGRADRPAKGAALFFAGLLLVQLVTVGHSRYTLPGWILLLPAGGAATEAALAGDRRTRLVVLVAAAILGAVWLRQALLETR